MSRWRKVVREELARYREQTGLSVVERQELLDQSLSRLEAEFPDNDTHGQSLSRTLQQLRDREEVGFLPDSPGTYRIQSLDCDLDSVLVSPDDTKTSSPDERPTYTASEYETTATGRRIHSGFREVVLGRYGDRCPVSGVDRPALLDVAHVLPWSEFPERRADFDNVLVLDKTHHAAFDRGLFTLDSEFRLRVNPRFETDSELLGRSLVERDGAQISLPAETHLSTEYVERHNERLDWSPT